MRSVHIIMPMGGLGTRTADRYNVPKPFIKIYNNFLFEYALDGVKVVMGTHKVKLTMIARTEMMDPYYIKKVNQIGWNYADEFNLIQIDKVTRGALETVMKAENLIEDDDICIVLDCDVLFESIDLYNIIERIVDDEDIDGFLLSFNSDKPKYSFAEIDNNNIVKRTAEKDPISNHAIAGVYGFSNGSLLKKYARMILNKPIEEYDKKEYYVSYIYNLMINDGARIILSYLDSHTSFGTSHEIEDFKASDNKFKHLYITDFDGTLFDTKEANYLAYQETFKKVYNYDLKPEDYYDNFGLRINELLEKLNLDISKLNEVKKTKARVYKKYFKNITINSGLLAELYYKKRSGHIIALATTASKKNVENIIKYFEISDLFDYIITGENVKNGKPDPEVYNKIIEHYYFVNPYHIIIFEDSMVGLMAAHNTIIPDANIVNINNPIKIFTTKFITQPDFINKRQSKTNTL